MHPAIIIALVALDTQPVAITWPLPGLNRELNFIAAQESYYGRYVNHEPNIQGPYHTAFGSLGLKGSTAHVTYLQSPWLRNRFPALEDRSAFLYRFWHDAGLYMYCANFHWFSLRHNTPNLERAVYAWRYGLIASNKATDSEVSADSYIIRYVALEKARLDSVASAHR